MQHRLSTSVPSGLSQMATRQSTRPTVKKQGLHVFDYVFVGLMFLAMGTSPFWKVQGPLILVSFVALCIAYAAHVAIVHRILFKSVVLAAWSVVGGIYVALSWLRWLPGEPEFFLREYVLRMGYFVFSIYPVTAALYAMFARVREHGRLGNLAIVGLVTVSTSALMFYASPPVDGHWIVEGSEIDIVSALIATVGYALTNTAILFWWSLTYLLRNSRAWIALCALIMFLSESAQMKLLGLILFAVWMVRQPFKVAVPLMAAIIAGFPLVALLLVGFGNQLGFDPNITHRASWWVDAMVAVLQTGGAGLGFGADSTRDFIVEDRFQMLGKWNRLPIHVIHNDYIYSFYSMGLIGGALFLWFHFKELAPRRAPDLASARHALFLLLAVCVATSANAALVSPQVLLGLCWVYAYLTVLNRRSNSVRRH